MATKLSAGKVILISLLITIILLPSEARAKHKSELGTEAYYYYHLEYDVMSQKGLMYGLNGAYRYQNKWFLEVDGRYAKGETDYSSREAGSSNKNKVWSTEIRITGGYKFELPKNKSIEPFIGIGGRFHEYDGRNRTTTTGHKSYRMTTEYLYSLVGATLKQDFSSGWSIELIAEDDVFWTGRTKSYPNEVNPDCKKTNKRQKPGHGARGSLKIVKNLEKINLSAEPFLRFWYVPNSEKQDGGCSIGKICTPTNSTYEAGLNVALGF